MEDKKALEQKFATVENNIEEFRKEKERICDDVCKIETERDLINKKIEVIDKTLERIDQKIDANKKIDEAEELNRKRCRYDNLGFCRQAEGCPFLHANEICDIYLETGSCWRKVCHKRHPRVCRYGSRCYRGKSCRYLHFNDSCDRCNEFSQKVYFCEFCSKNFCEHCTTEKAHIENIYEVKSPENPSCTKKPNCAQIHQE